MVDISVSRSFRATEFDLPFVLTADGDNRPRWRPGERLQQLFETVAANPRSATRIAVSTTASDTSFAELDGCANRLARHLCALGIKSGDVVALIFGRCIDSYVAMLAVLKLNATYVPLDPAFPADRIRYICDDAAVSAILCLDAHRVLADGIDSTLVVLDADAATIAAHPSGPLGEAEVEAPVSETAYIIYTSGSTGRPKGVVIEHPAIVNFVRVALERYGYRPDDRIYQGLTLAFDFSVEEVWVPLLAGACLVPNEHGANLIGDELATFLAERRITALCCVPTLLATIECDLPNLRLLIVSGEACASEIVRRWHRPGRTILNAYGPTEITVTATVDRLRPDEPITIGVPLPTYSVVILEPGTMEVLPRGETGEIVIGGIGVSPGYLNLAEKTAQAFVEDTIGLPYNVSGRLYRSGDLGRIDERERIEYLGRIDTQVKIRGYRIEVGEIESAIMGLPSIAQAVVTKHEAGAGIEELAVYYTVSEGTLAPKEIAAFLSRTLPDFMVPAWYTMLDTMPLLPSGKADRKALPPPQFRVSSGRSGEGERPATDFEARLSVILCDLTGMSDLGVTDDFFAELNLNSLVLARFATRIRKELGTGAIAIRTFYERPTIRELANALDTPEEEPDVAAPDRHVKFSSVRVWIAGLSQFSIVLLYSTLIISLSFAAFDWALAAAGWASGYARAALVSFALTLLLWLLPVAIKWLVVGRMGEERFAIYSRRYLAFWVAHSLIRANPIRLLAGTPAYNVYLRLLGARVSLSAVVMGAPILAPDMVRIGPRAVVMRDADLSGYRAEAGEIVTGPIDIGADAFVGVGATLDIRTAVGAGAELGHASCLQEGQLVPGGHSWHGNPGRPTATRFCRVPSSPASTWRAVVYALASLALPTFLFGPIGIAVLDLVYRKEGNSPLHGHPVIVEFGPLAAALPLLLLLSAAMFAAGIVFAMARVTIPTWIARPFLKPGVEYPLYGVRHALVRLVKRSSNSLFLNLLFGDSVFITAYLARIGYRFDRLFQTGSNFGSSQQQDVPFLCQYGHRAMASDGIIQANAEYASGAVRLGATAFGERTYLGNKLYAIPGMKIGENVLIGSKTAIPIDGPLRSDTGILGSPAFEIPRSVERDKQLTRFKDEAVRQAALRAKTHHNIVTILFFLALRWSMIVISVVLVYRVVVQTGLWSPLVLTTTGMAAIFLGILLHILAERLSIGFGRLAPLCCSIYQPSFWRVERYWKLAVWHEINLFNGTPVKPVLWRLMGVRIGCGVFDDGCQITERTLVEIGDHATLNRQTIIQCHSLEDGVFKSEPTRLGDRVTLAPHAYIHYGVEIGSGALIGQDSFVMKGETVEPGVWWQGNPATTRKQGEATPKIVRVARSDGQPREEVDEPVHEHLPLPIIVEKQPGVTGLALD